MKYRRILALLLATLMLSACFVGCQSGGTDTPTTVATTPLPSETTLPHSETTPDVQTETTPATEATTQVPNLDGYELLIGNSRRAWKPEPVTQLETEMMDLYYDIESTYNCIISGIDVDDETLVASFIAGDSVASCIDTRQQFWGPPAVAGFLRPLETQEMKDAGLDITNPDIVDVQFTNMTELAGHVWCAAFSGKYYVSDFGHALAFNKRLLQEVGYSDTMMYDLVRSGEWNWETFETISRAISIDTDGDGENDIEGYASLANEYQELLSNGCPFVYQDEATGKWLAGTSNQKMITAAEWFMKLLADPDVCMGYLSEATFGMSNGARRTMFCEGKLGFIALWGGNFGAESDRINNAAIDDYGFIPFPKGPDATEYPHYIPDLYGISIPMSNQDWEKTAFLLGIIGDAHTDDAEARAFVRNYMCDDESVEMIFDVMYPVAQCQTSRYSPAIREVTEEFVDYFKGGEYSAAQVCEMMSTKLQAAVDALFKQ